MSKSTSPHHGDTHRLVGLCVSFFVLFSSYFATQNYVTPTLGAFGSLSLGLLYGTLALVACAAPACLRRLQRLCSARRDSLRSETVALACGSLMYAPFPLVCAARHLRWAQLLGSVVLGCGAGLLWVAQGSLLTACTTEANRGRWSGVFWAAFMAGNAAGNFSSAALVRATSVSTMFVVLSGVAALSSVCFAALVRPRRTVRLATGRDDGDDGGASAHADLLHDAAALPAQSVGDDLRALGGVLARRETLCLLPLLLFIGAENAFWGGEFASLVSRLGAADSVGLVVGSLALADMAASVLAGLLIDRGRPLVALLLGLAAFGAALLLVTFQLLPLLATDDDDADDANDDANDDDPSSLPWTAFAAAALMGTGDAAANTVALSRLGSLAEAKHLPREAVRARGGHTALPLPFSAHATPPPTHPHGPGATMTTVCNARVVHRRPSSTSRWPTSP